MWLPKDERKLLRYYYRKINKLETSQILELKDIAKELKKRTPLEHRKEKQ